jgi:DNA-directed RNA polymerase subunit RPC12/RpoP
MYVCCSCKQRGDFSSYSGAVNYCPSCGSSNIVLEKSPMSEEEMKRQQSEMVKDAARKGYKGTNPLPKLETGEASKV